MSDLLANIAMDTSATLSTKVNDQHNMHHEVVHGARDMQYANSLAITREADADR